MAEQFKILDEQIGGELFEGYRLIVYCLLEDETETGEINFLIIDKRDQRLIHTNIGVEVSNPMILTTAILVAAGKYGGCVAATMTGSTVALIYGLYEESKEKKPKIKKWHRLKDVFARLKGRKAQLKTSAAGALASCAVIILT